MGEAITAAGSWKVKAWPTCGEASVTFVKDRRESIAPVLAVWELDGSKEITKAQWDAYKEHRETNEDRSTRRSRASIRRYARHNALVEMVTFTFAGEPPEFDSLSGVMSAFWKRFERSTGRSRGAYCWVPEWGKATHRLHVHMAVDWWGELNCVEVCERCDKFGVLDRYKNHRGGVAQDLRNSRTCVGCLWGHGFVGRPVSGEGEVESNEDGRGLSKYLSKYLGKDLDVGGGRQRYRVGEGNQPECIELITETPDEAVSLAVSSVHCRNALGESLPDQTPIMFVPRWDDGYGPPVILLDWLNKERLSEENQNGSN
jgi:hypothetical protein